MTARVPNVSGPEIFPATRWSLVLTAGGEGSPEADAALERLCVSYREPVGHYLRSLGIAAVEADDLVQGFFQSLIKRNSFARVSPDRGRFRSYLKAALRYHLIDQRRRLPPGTPVELDALEPDERESIAAGEDPHPGDALDRAWAEHVLHLAYLRLENRQKSEADRSWFEALRLFLSDEPGPGDYARIGEQFGTTANTTAKRVQRLREEFDACVRAELLETVGTPSEVEHEIRALFS
jgi:RNA polymerase sigma-70 factor (ECF subfamily)